MVDLVKFPSLDQFRNAIQNVKRKATYKGKDENGDPIYGAAELPKLKYKGTVKLHGTNAAVSYQAAIQDANSANVVFSYQSRERILSIGQDNAGFMLYMSQHTGIFSRIVLTVAGRHNHTDAIAPMEFSGDDTITIFGEWCGSGIQKGVAISEVPKMFVIFGIKINDTWIDFSSLVQDDDMKEARIYFIHQFPTWEIEIDFAHPELAQNELIKITEAVEAECPVGKHFGVSGVGEGVVWTCQTEGWRSYDHAFKVKGEKHSVSKVKTLAAVDVEAVQALKDFVDQVVTEARLEQGVWNLVHEQLKPLDMTSMGDFIRWVYNDVLKEETDTIVASQFDPKKLGGPIANKARPWYIAHLNANV